MKYKITVLIALSMFLFICSLSTISAANNTINSTSTGGIAQGITDTGIGETLFLQPGTYNKTGNDTGITINKNITIQGNGSTDSVIIDAQGLSRIFWFSAQGKNITLINITFINGNSSNGGGVYLQDSAGHISIINCTFENNIASTSNGGALDIRGHADIIENCIFINNTANSAGGGAIFCSNNMLILNSLFKNNKATVGGAIRNGNRMYITNSTFINNSADNGSAISKPVGISNITNSTFINNTANNIGTIHIFDYYNNTNYTHFFTNVFMKDNSALKGSGVYVDGTGFNITIKNSDFSNNLATDGFIIESVNKKANLIIMNTNITDNTGGGVYNNGIAEVINNTFAKNTAGAIYNDGDMTVSKNIALNQVIYNNGTMGVLTLIYLSNSTLKTSRGYNVTIYVTLTDDMGNTVTGQDISFYVDGVFIANVTSIEGKANTTYLVTKGPGSVLPVTGDYAGHDGYSIVLKNGELLVPKIPTNITIDVPENLKVGEDTTITSKLTDKDGNPIANATIDFYVDGKKIGSAITDENGVAKINHTFNKAGKPTITAKYAGNETYEASNVNGQTTVSKIKTNLELKTDNETITATLTDEDGNPLANKKITIKIKGKTFTGTTDVNGQVIIKFPNANKYKVTAKFAGDDRHVPSNATVPGESEPNEPSSDVLASGKVAMKSTGIHIIAILLSLIASMGLLAIRKKD